MATNFKIDKERLDKTFSRLLSSERDHAYRCCEITKFLLKKCSCLEWYLNNNINPDNYALAVYYHDIGKTSKADKDARNNVEKMNKSNSYLHVIEGIDILSGRFDLKINSVKENSFEYLLYYSVAEHHETLDGKGYPYNKKGYEMTLIGKICSLVNYFDNYLIKDKETKPNVSRAIKKITEKRKIWFDESMVDSLLEDRKSFELFVKGLFTTSEEPLRKDLGINFEYVPIYSRNKILSFIIADDYIIDSIYGETFKDSYLKYLIDLDLYNKYDHALIFKTINLIHKLEENKKIQNVPPFIVRICLKEFENTDFNEYLLKVINKYKIDKSHLYLSISTDESISYNVDIKNNLSSLSNEGINLVLEGYDSLKYKVDYEELGFKYAMLSYENKELARDNIKNSILKGASISLSNFGIKVILTYIDKPLSIDFLKECMVEYVSGFIYHDSITKLDLFKFLSGAVI